MSPNYNGPVDAPPNGYFYFFFAFYLFRYYYFSSVKTSYITREIFSLCTAKDDFFFLPQPLPPPAAPRRYVYTGCFRNNNSYHKSIYYFFCPEYVGDFPRRYVVLGGGGGARSAPRPTPKTYRTTAGPPRMISQYFCFLLHRIENIFIENKINHRFIRLFFHPKLWEFVC